VGRTSRVKYSRGSVSNVNARGLPKGCKSYRRCSSETDARQQWKTCLIPFVIYSQDTENNEASELSMKNVGGVFIVLCSGVGVAAILASLEMFWTLWKTSSKEKVGKKRLSVSIHNLICSSISLASCENRYIRYIYIRCGYAIYRRP